MPGHHRELQVIFRQEDFKMPSKLFIYLFIYA